MKSGGYFWNSWSAALCILSGCNFRSLAVASYFLSLSPLCLIELGLIV